MSTLFIRERCGKELSALMPHVSIRIDDEDRKAGARQSPLLGEKALLALASK